jgi:curved DNA-binding protein CbpA
MSLDSVGLHSALEAALLDYQRSPGRYRLAARQPRVLFAAIKEVLQIASGRSIDGSETARPDAALQQAAGFFIRSACLHPGADHYALLGLEQQADAAAVKDHYRLMMRLLHPDFARSWPGAPWPEDAAARVNLAYEVLSSELQRRAYDDRVRRRAPQRPARTESQPAALRTTPAELQRPNPRGRLKQLAILFGAVGTLVLLAVLFAGGSAVENLVQRSRGLPLSRAGAVPEGDQSADVPGHAARAVSSRREAKASMARSPSPPASVAPAPANVSAAVAVETKPRSQPAPLVAQVAPPPVVNPEAIAAPSTSASRPAAASAPMAPRAPAPSAATGSLTIADAHPLLSVLLQHMESGWSDRMLSMLDRDARASAGAQSLVARYDALVDGARPVKLSGIKFRSEPRDGRLLVTGRVLIQVRDQPAGTPAKELALQAEFASREGTVVMTRLSTAPE